MPSASATCYSTLGIANSATPEEVEAAWRRKIKRVHPDLAKSEADRVDRTRLSAQVNAAYTTLHDQGKRAAYDLGLRRAEEAAAQAAAERRARPQAATTAAAAPARQPVAQAADTRSVWVQRGSLADIRVRLAAQGPRAAARAFLAYSPAGQWALVLAVLFASASLLPALGASPMPLALYMTAAWMAVGAVVSRSATRNPAAHVIAVVGALSSALLSAIGWRIAPRPAGRPGHGA
jgi:hypothetical protein